jgi:transposase
VGPPLQSAGPRRHDLPPHRRSRPLFDPARSQQVVDLVEATGPVDHGLPGHGWTLKKLKQWVSEIFGRLVSRGTIRRALRRANLTWKKVKKLLSKADPQKRAAHIEELLKLFTGACDGEVILIYADEVHIHRDLDSGYTWGRRGQRLWRPSDCPRRSERMNAYGAYDFTHGECLLWQDGWCDGQRTVEFLRELVRWRADKVGRLVLIWDNAPCHVAKVVKAEAGRLGIEVVNLPGYSPDLNPIERLWDWMRAEVTRGFCHASVAELIASCQAFVERINGDPLALIDRLWPKFELDPEFEAKPRVST